MSLMVIAFLVPDSLMYGTEFSKFKVWQPHNAWLKLNL